MSGVLLVAMLWTVFGGSHLLFASPPARDALVGRLGERGFVLSYSVFAALTFTALVVAFALYRGDGPAGPALGRWPFTRSALMVIAFGGAVLMVAGVLGYFRSPAAVFRTEVRPPRDIERVTRHPFFVGTILMTGAHALLAPTLAGAVFFGGFVALALGGIPLQDRKLARRYGDAYARYCGATSIVPFAALLRGVPAAADDRWLRVFLPAVIAAAVARALHPWWLAGYGLPMALLISGGGLYIVARRWTRAPARPAAAAR